MKMYTVWLEGSEATDYLLTWSEALACKKYWKKKGYKTTIQEIKDEGNTK